MLQFGSPPYYECSSRGDRRLSAFFARVKRRGNRTIEEIYQGFKLFENGVSGLSPKEAKGKYPINMDDCRILYSLLWDEYFHENSNLLLLAKRYTGFSDMFGQEGHVCQAEEIYRIVTHDSNK